MPTVLIAPDSFGDSLTAVAAADAIATGWRRARPGDRLVLAPQSDGGPGFAAVLAGRLGGRRTTRVRGPLGDAVDADWVLHRAGDDGAAAGGLTAYIECAQACGLPLLGGPPDRHTAVAGSTAGVGDLVAAALDAGADRIVVGLGGSATTDGGRGMVEVLAGGEPSDGGVSDGTEAVICAARRVAGMELIAATDVDHPLLGEHGAAAVFGPQKGADPETIAVLEARLSGWARDLAAATGRDVAALPGAGAAGGLGAALLALGAHRRSGAAVIAEHTGLEADLDTADVVITGEGRFDDQSLHGKVVSALADGARARNLPVLVLAGQVRLSDEERRAAGVTAAYSLVEHCGSVERALAEAAGQLTDLAARTAAAWAE